jgi:formylglycine-generating enzyme required for sulfatase activity
MPPARGNGLRSTFLLIVWSLGLAGSSSAAAPPQPGSGGTLLLDVRPRVVYRGIAVRVRARLRPGDPAHPRGSIPDAFVPPEPEPLPEGARVRWESGGGLLLSDDLPEIDWRAPSREGRTWLAVEVALPDRTLTGRLEVDVRAPSTEDMAWIPPGNFLCGDLHGTRNLKEIKTVQNASDEPFHTVHLDGYWIDRHLVTNEKYKAFLEEAIGQGLARVEDVAVMGEFEGSWVPFYYLKSYVNLIADYYSTVKAKAPAFSFQITHDAGGFHVMPGKERCPVADVTWYGAEAYLRFRGKRLPSEAEWEKAARGVDGARFPWGDGVPNAYRVNLNSALGHQLLPVGQFSPEGDSPYGVTDMVSEAFEWTGDWFNPYYYADSYSEAPLHNPRGTSWGRSHSIRGFPSILQFPKASVEEDEPVSFRYSWRFEFMIGDTFGNDQTAFRGVASEAERP